MNLTLYFAAFLGAIIYALFDYVGKKGVDVLTKKYIFITIANILAGCALIWGIDLKEGVMSIGWFDAAKIVSMFFGIAGQKLFKSVMDITDSTVKTKIGINRKTK